MVRDSGDVCGHTGSPAGKPNPTNHVRRLRRVRKVSWSSARTPVWRGAWWAHSLRGAEGILTQGTALSAETEVESASGEQTYGEKVGWRDGHGPSPHGQESGLYPFRGGGPVFRVWEGPGMCHMSSSPAPLTDHSSISSQMSALPLQLFQVCGVGHAPIFSCRNTKIATSCWTTIDRRMLEPTKKRYPHDQGHRRSFNKIVGGEQSCLK